ncbi:phage capsid protein, partial [Streptomyces sp. A73]|nr:phage capsid protein [Streptomyces sp. A73]
MDRFYRDVLERQVPHDGHRVLRESQEGSHFGLAPDDRLVTLYLPDQTIHAVEEDGGWVVIDR